MNVLQSQKLVAIDVDGTISSAGGPVEANDIRALENKGIIWGILSSRSKDRSNEACEAIGIKPHFIEVCRIDQRAEELGELASRYKAAEYIYVADREVDYKEAKLAGWRFIFASSFREVCI